MGKIRLLQDKSLVLDVKSAQQNLFQPKAGKKYQLVFEGVNKSAQQAPILMVKKGSHLHVLLPDNTTLVLENFYLECAVNQCQLEVNQVTITTRSGPNGPASGDNSVVYAQGASSDLYQMAQGNPVLSENLHRFPVQQGQLTILPDGAAAAQTGSSLAQVSSVVGGMGPGLLLAGLGVAGAAGAAGGGGGGGGGGASNTSASSKVRIKSSSSLQVNENETLVSTLKADKTTGLAWSLDNSGNTENAVDNNLFEINSSTGALSFKAAPDYENPNHVPSYKVQVKVSYSAVSNLGVLSTVNDVQAITVAVNNQQNEIKPSLQWHSAIDNGATSAEATTVLLTLNAIDQNNRNTSLSLPNSHKAIVTFKQGNTTLNKEITGTGSPLVLSLTAAELRQFNDGIVSVSAISKDAAGNSSSSVNSSFRLDTTLPTLSGSSSISVAEGNRAIATLRANETVTWQLDSSGADASAYADNGLFTVQSNTGALTWQNNPEQYSLRGSNPYRLRVRLTDSAGNIATQNLTLHLTDVAGLNNTPNLALSGGASAPISREEALNPLGLLQVSALESGQYAKVTLSNGSGSPVVKQTARYQGSALGMVLEASDLTSLGDGTITASAISVDSAGNTSARSSLLTFVLDSTAPSITSSDSVSLPERFNTVMTATANDQSSVTWSLDRSGNDASRFADNSLFQINSNGVISWLSGNGRDFEGATKSANNSNTYFLRIAATDAAGNRSTQNIQVSVNNENEAPRILSLPSSATVTSGVDSPLPDFSFSDPDLNDSLIVRLSVTAGLIDVSAATGLTITGNRSANVLLSGSSSVVNAAIQQATLNTSSNTTLNIAYGDASNSADQLPNNSSLSILAIQAPIISGFTASDSVGNASNGLAAQELSLSVDFSQAITVTGTPTLVFQVGSNSSHLVTASYVSGSSSQRLVFKAAQGAPLGSSGALKLIQINTDASNSLQNNTTALNTSIVNQVSEYQVDNTPPSIGYLSKEYHARNLLISSSEAEAYHVLDQYFADASANQYRLSTSQLNTFAALAGVYNTDSSRQTGGEYLDSGYWAAPSAYVSEYAAAMVNLQVGQMTAIPIKTRFGWHYIYLQEVREVNASDNGSGIDIRVLENTPANQKIASFSSNESNATWSLEGADQALFSIQNGELRLLASPNFESPSDQGANNVYNLAVVLTDLAGNISKRQITVNVANDIVGEISNSLTVSGATNGQASANAVLTASDAQVRSGGESNVLNASWRWQKRAWDGVWTDIEGANSASYTLGAEQNALSVRAIASYQASNGQVMRQYSSPIAVAIAPRLQNALPDMWLKANSSVNWQLPDQTFVDYDSLTYRADGLSGSGISFDATTRRFTGNFTSSSAIQVTVSATDSTGLTSADSFTITPSNAPVIQSIQVSDAIGAQTAGAPGSALTIRLSVSEAVNVTAGTSLNFQVGDNPSHTMTAVYSSGSGSNQLVFTSSNGAPANSSGKIKLLGLVSGNIQASAGNTALSAAFSPVDPDYRVDSSAPVVTSIALSSATGKQGNWLNQGDTVRASLRLDEDIQVLGNPLLTLNIGNTTGAASLVAADSNSRELIFQYTLPAGVNDAQGIAIGALQWNGGSIQNHAGLSLSPTVSAAANPAYRVDTTAPATPLLTLDNALLLNHVNRSEALQSNLIRVNGVDSGDQLEVVLTRGSAGRVVKSYTSNGNQIQVQLNDDDIATLGNGNISLSVQSKDAAGNVSGDAAFNSANNSYTSFTLDTLAPASPMLSLAQNIADGASSSEAKSNTGVLNVLAELGSTINLRLTNAGGVTLDKTLSGATNALPLVLSDSDLSTLGLGQIQVSASASDAAGNTSLSSLIRFNVI